MPSPGHAPAAAPNTQGLAIVSAQAVVPAQATVGGDAPGFVVGTQKLVTAATALTSKAAPAQIDLTLKKDAARLVDEMHEPACSVD